MEVKKSVWSKGGLLSKEIPYYEVTLTGDEKVDLWRFLNGIPWYSYFAINGRLHSFGTQGEFRRFCDGLELTFFLDRIRY
jgi:hypothetical protein